MGRQLTGRDLSRRVESKGVKIVCKELGELFESKQADPNDFSISDLYEHLVPNGYEAMRLMDHRKRGGFQAGHFPEAVAAVDTATFSNITGQIVYSAVREAFDDQMLLHPYLVKPMRTVFAQGEKIPGIGRMGDETEAIGEGNPYPNLGLNEEWVVSPQAQKRGWKIGVTREMVIADRTGLLMQRISEGATWLAINKEKRCLDVCLGITNNYNRNGTATNTYLTSGAYINDQTGNALASGSWLSVERAELLFDAITDPNTGEPVMITGDTLIVPTALKRTALRILHATSIRFNDGASNTTAAYGPNPLSQRDNQGGKYKLNAPGEIQVLSSAYVKQRTSSATKWFFGSPMNAFRYSEIWGIETMQAPAGNPAEFDHDIVSQYKVSEFGVAWVYEPRAMTRNDT